MLKKVLTNHREVCYYIWAVSERRTLNRRAEQSEELERQTILENDTEESIQSENTWLDEKSKEQSVDLREREFGCFSEHPGDWIEHKSLILAQDERWRRA